MKKLLILSDSHGNVKNMMRAAEEAEPDLILHLGDCWADSGRLHSALMNIPMERVPGNCDCTCEQEERIVRIEGKDVLLCHGHTFNVKAGYLNLKYAAQERGVQVALFGHTHRVFYGVHNGIVYLNPGSIGSPPYGIPASYGVMEIDAETGKIDYDVKYIE